MKTVGRSAACAVLIAAWAWAVLAREGTPELPVQIRYEVSPLVECYFMLRVFGPDTGWPGPAKKADVTSEAAIFARARETLQDEAGWRWFEDQVVAGPDPAAIRKATQVLPATLDSPSSRTGINMLMDGLESAYPKFMADFWPERQASLSRTLVDVRRRYVPAEKRIVETLMQKMAFSPIDGPIRILMVIQRTPATSWGKVEGGYYAVVGVRGFSTLSIIESGLHEATHILDSLQSFNGHWLLRDVRKGAGADEPAELDSFLHGLMVYNAGALVTRFLDPDYRPLGIRMPSQQAEYAPYLSTYEQIWEAYLDGKMSYDAIVAKLVEEFKAVRAQKKPAPKPS